MHADEEQSDGGPWSDSTSALSTSGSPATRAYRAAGDAMRKMMNVQAIGDASVDLTWNMIDHRRGAVDMARMVVAWLRP